MVISLPYDIIENQKLKENLISLENGMVYHELKDGTKTEITTSYLGKFFYGVASSDECIGDTIKIIFKYQEEEMATLGKVFEEETKIGYPNINVYFVDTLSKEVFTAVTDSSDGLRSTYL
jgi:hypothetical protein